MAPARALVVLLSLLSCVAAQESQSEPPKKGSGRYGGPLGYYPTVAPAIIFAALYALVAVHVTLFVQASGGSLAAAKNETLTKLSTKIFLAGLILQLISFITYCVVFAVFLYRVKTWRAPTWHEKADKGLLSHWKGLVGIMFISCLGIIVRCIYRTVEGSEGFSGYLLTHEIYFYVLDCLPLLIAIAVYAIVWPPAILENLYSPPGHEMDTKDVVGSP
ncbi:hypothetical protein FRC07_001508 [Ceratobasidium sp. 392]|nr:hypothetical protein FRC07_001508 [Ceratobasidium sp. 392]